MATNKMYKYFIYNRPFKGLPILSNFKIAEEKLPSLKDNEYLVEAVYIRTTPNIAATTSINQLNNIPKATQLAKIIESKNKNFSVGQYVIGNFGWQTHTIADPLVSDKVYLVPEINNLPQTLTLGVLGEPGIAAYFGFIEICKPSKNDVVVVSSAAGAVGSWVGQIAKIKGCKVIGIAGSKEKCLWLSEIGFDHCINYKEENVKEKLKEFAPDGIDCYFDNVGGELSGYVIYQMKLNGRICICGATALYYDNTKVDEVQSPIKVKLVKMEGILINRWSDQWGFAIKQNLQWLNENKLKPKETIIENFENIPQTFIDVLKGKYCGNVLIKV